MKCIKELIFLTILICFMIPIYGAGATIQGKVVSFDNTPISNGDVILYAVGLYLIPLAQTTTDSEGNYTLGIDLAGICDLRAYYNSGCYKTKTVSIVGGTYTVNFEISPDIYWRDVDYNGGIGPWEHDYSFAIIADPHIGSGEDDYGSSGYDDEPPVGDAGNSAKRLRYTVDWINTYKEVHDIRFVAVLGDITDSGERSEFLKAKEILDALDIPWIPIIGNHDVWPYCAGYDTHESDDLPNQWFFDPQYQHLMDSYPSWNWKRQPVPQKFYFQQFSFDYGYYHFLCCDFNNREAALTGGVWAEADILAYDGSARNWAWFTHHLSQEAPRFIENIVFLMHHNFDEHALVCFRADEYNQIKSYFNQEILGQVLHTQFGGHHHEDKVEYDSDLGLTRVITDACEEGEAGRVRVVRMFQPVHLFLKNDIIPIDLSIWISYKASDSIVAAADDTYFIIEGDGENGPKITMAAGNKVKLKAGFHAQEGCYFRASTDFWPDDFTPTLSSANQSKKSEKDSTKTSIELSSKETKKSIPKVFSCAQNYPNPFATSTTIKYGLPKDVDVQLDVYNLLGQKVRTLVNTKQSAGYKQVSWDGRTSNGGAAPKGIYFYTFRAGDYIKHHKMILLK